MPWRPCWAVHCISTRPRWKILRGHLCSYSCQAVAVSAWRSTRRARIRARCFAAEELLQPARKTHGVNGRPTQIAPRSPIQTRKSRCRRCRNSQSLYAMRMYSASLETFSARVDPQRQLTLLAQRGLTLITGFAAGYFPRNKGADDRIRDADEFDKANSPAKT